MQDKPFILHLTSSRPELLQDALLPAAGRPLRFDGKAGFPGGQRRYHEVKRERADGRGGASHWAARDTGLALVSTGDATEILKNHKTHFIDISRNFRSCVHLSTYPVYMHL